jgi:hypothetical protein
MPTREELHKLVNSLPDEAIRAAHLMLSKMQVWPQPPPPDVQEIRKRMELRAGLGSSGYDPDKGSGYSSFEHWDGDALIVETHRHHQGRDLTIIERIRAEGKRLIYRHEISGPGDKHDEREIVFELS